MKKFNITVNGTTYEVDVEEIAGVPSAPVAQRRTAPVPVAKSPTPVVKKTAAKVAPPAGGSSVTAPMPGTMFEIKVEEGDNVSSGDVLCILEAMKMENEIMSPCDGKVLQVSVGKGASVNSGDVLIVIG